MMSSLGRLHSRVTPIITRAASTQARSLSAVLSRNPEDVVITFAKRTPIGRSKKGQFKDTPIDEILYGLFKVRCKMRLKSIQFVIPYPGYFGADQPGPQQD